MNLYRFDIEKSLEFQLGRSTAGTHRRGAPLSPWLHTYLKICLWFTPQKMVFLKMTWLELEEKTKLSFFLDDNHNTSIDALIFDNCYWFISSLWKLSRFIWKINAKISSKYQDKIELSSLVFRWIKIRSNNQDLYLGVHRRPWGEWAGWVSRVSKALKTKRFYTKLWWKIGSSCC